MGGCLSSNAATLERKNREIDAAFGNDSIHVMMSKPSRNGDSDGGGYVPRAPLVGAGGGGAESGSYRPRSSTDALREKQRQKQQQEQMAATPSSANTAPDTSTDESS